jgi:hypothetical protein
MGNFELRFWSRVIKTPTCWIWQGPPTPKGYGRLKKNGRMVFAHRVAYTLAGGRIPDGLFVLHNCPDGDNPLCVNPAHLFLGTLTDNNRDRAQKGRSATGDRSGMRLHPDRHPAKLHPESHVRGESHPAAKLTGPIVLEIRRRYGQGGVSQRQLAQEYDIDQSCVSEIVNGKAWTHVNVG